jgi:uncharacterized protein (DUF2062 family)
MPRRKFFFSKYLPDVETVRASRAGRWFGRWLDHPGLWHLNRRSVPGAVAIGLFAGLVPGPLQMLTALLLAVPLRKNVPLALLLTFYTNPFTIVPLYLLGYWYGSVLLGLPYAAPTIAGMDWAAFAALGRPLAVGVLALALTLAAVGYVAARLAWRTYVVGAWRARRRRRRRAAP